MNVKSSKEAFAEKNDFEKKEQYFKKRNFLSFEKVSFRSVFRQIRGNELG